MQTEPTQTYLPTAKVQARYGKSHVTIWRWAKDPELGFPKPMQIRGQNYWKLADLEAFEAAQLEAA